MMTNTTTATAAAGQAFVVQTAHPVDRWFIRCGECLTIASVEGKPAMEFTYLVASCGICGSRRVENMGRVERDRLVHQFEQCACDARCTSARGPHCDCSCGGKNHGTGRTVVITVDAGAVPVVRFVDDVKARKQVEEFRAGIAAVLAVMDGYKARRDRGEFLPRPEFDRWRECGRVLVTARKARTHAARMKQLGSILQGAAA
jgi:hypothetical protein